MQQQDRTSRLEKSKYATAAALIERARDAGMTVKAWRGHLVVQGAYALTPLAEALRDERSAVLELLDTAPDVSGVFSAAEMDRLRSAQWRFRALPPSQR